MGYPAEMKYTKSHEWLKADGAAASVGITDYAQHSLGDIVFVELPKVGDKVEAGKIFGSVESVKAVSDLFAPASGTVTEINEELVKAPEKINEAANATWIYKFELADANELTGLTTLLDAPAYESFVSEETGH
jgi:glycine cleavage system H protein